MEESFYEILNHKYFIFNEVISDNKVTNTINFPIHINRIVKNICVLENERSSISPSEILDNNYILQEKMIVNDSLKIIQC